MSVVPIQEYNNLITSKELQEAIDVEKVCLFIGAGVARNLGMPTWEGLASQITEFCSRNEIFNHSLVHTLLTFKDPLKVITFCVQEIEKTDQKIKFEDFLYDIFITQPQKNFEDNCCETTEHVYNNLIELYNSQKILMVQTNYDNIIEKGSRIKNKNIYIPFIDDQKTKLTKDMLVYLHGKIDEKRPSPPFSYQNLVLTRNQYNDMYVLRQDNEKFEKQETFFKKLLKEYHIIFLGYSLQDTEIVQFIANKGVSESYLKISVIVDQCEANRHLNEINSKYLYEASNKNVKTYFYNTEEGGVSKNFAMVVDLLKRTILKEKQASGILKYIDPCEVDFS